MASTLHLELPRGAVIAAIALGGFAAGVVVTELAHRRDAAPTTEPARVASPAPAPPARVEATDAGAPRILFDPASITLLPDASLELALPPGFDAGR